MMDQALLPRPPTAMDCRAVLAEGSKSFALAARLLAEPARTQAAVLYAFCRHVDDAIDLCPRERQGRALERLQARVDAVYRREPQPDALWQAFAELVRALSLPRAYPDELLLGMRMDVLTVRYATLDDLLLYCYRVAGVVGCMLCHVFGLSRSAALREASHLGIAMQLTNICRDVLEDWQRGRLYLPESELTRAGATGLAADLGGPFPNAAAEPVARAVERLLSVADRFYRSADRGLSALPYRAALAVRAASRVYRAIGTRIRARGCDVRQGRAVVSTGEKLAIVLASGLASLGELPARGVRRARYAAPAHLLRFPEDVLE